MANTSIICKLSCFFLIALIYVCTFRCIRGDLKIHVDDDNGHVALDIKCEQNDSAEGAVKKNDNISLSRNIYIVRIIDCPPPEKTYADILRTIPVTFKGLRLKIINVRFKLEDKYFKGLESLTRISTENYGLNYYFEPSEIIKYNGKIYAPRPYVRLNCSYWNELLHNNTTSIKEWLKVLPSLPFDKEVNIKYFIMYKCPLWTFYGELLQWLGVYPVFETLHLHDAWELTELTDTRLTGLSVDFVNVNYKYDIIYVIANSTGSIDLRQGSLLYVHCSDDAMIDKLSMPIFHQIQTVQIKKMQIVTCPIPSSTYKMLFSGINVNYSYIIDLTLNFNDIIAQRQFDVDHFKELSGIKYLTINGTGMTNIINITPDHLRPLINLSKLDVMYVTLSELPEENQLQDVQLVMGWSTGVFKGCTKLRQLTLMQWDVPGNIKKGWLANCSQLRTMTLKDMSVSAVRHALSTIKTLTSLTIENCNINTITQEFFKDVTQLVELYLPSNGIERIQSFSFQSQDRTLEVVDLSNNKLSQWRMVQDELMHLNVLKYIFLGNNDINEVCGYKTISATGSRQCVGYWQKLQFLDLTYNKITKLKFNELSSIMSHARNHSIHIDLRNNPLHMFPDTLQEMEQTKKDFSLIQNATVRVSLALDCDCEYAMFARILRETPSLTVRGANCSTKKDLMNIEMDRLMCEKTTCDLGCVCRRSLTDDMVDAECHSVTRMPRISTLHKLNVSGCYIDKILPQDIPSTLIDLDLSNNHLSRMDPETVRVLFSVKERRIKLAGNKIACENCENYVFISEIQSHQEQVDYENITCDGGGMLSKVDIGNICKEERERNVLVASSVSGALGFVALVMIFLYWRYKKPLKMFLYTHGLCMRWLHEEEVDTDRPYDAFVSFSHRDETFVFENLLPGLENIPQPYKICVHTRDWIAGELIPTQIARSVRLSRRTIIVLSKNFVESIWGMLEFRTAYMNSLSEGRPRIILIVLDDVLVERTLDLDLREYVATTTYLSWGDKWFWKKLAYSMPHRRCDGSIQSSNPGAARLEQLPNVN